MALTTFSGGTVFGERLGSGPPRVLGLHGWARDRRDLLGVLEDLDALAVDLPGFGATPPPDQAWGSADYARALSPVIDELERPAVVVGHSFGGRVALYLAAQRPDVVRALLLSGVPLLAGPARAPSPAYRVARALNRAHLLGDGPMEALRQRRGSADYRSASGVMRDILVRVVSERYEAELEALACPVELVWGEHDTAAPLESARRALELLPEARLTVCAGADHFALLGDPAPFRSALSRLLDPA